MKPITPRIHLPHSSIVLTAVVVCAALTAWAASSAHAAAPGLPPSGKVMLGVYADDIEAFSRQTRRRHHLKMMYFGWGQGIHWGVPIESRLARSRDGAYRLVIHITTKKNGNERFNPRELARGLGDAYLMPLSDKLNRSNQTVYIRYLAEQNGWWNPYSAYRQDGSSRGESYTTAWYKRAWRRMSIIMRGGSKSRMNRRLAAIGLPPIRSSIRWMPASGRIATVWNPQGAGNPEIFANRPAATYPGDSYVDWVGVNIFSFDGRAFWRGMRPLYDLKRKPFMIAEYAPWGQEDPRFVTNIHKFVAEHPRVRAVAYYVGVRDEDEVRFGLWNKPETRRAYRDAVAHRRYYCPNCGKG